MKKILSSMIFVTVLGGCSTTSDRNTANISSIPTQGEAATVEHGGMLEGGSKMSSLADPGHILSQRSVFFDFDSFVVESKYHDMLSAHAQYLTTHPEMTIIIQGNTDNRGTAEYNVALGQKRAEAVKKTMNLLGVPDRKIETISFGKERPKEIGHSEEVWAKNRRADIVYTGQEQ